MSRHKTKEKPRRPAKGRRGVERTIQLRAPFATEKTSWTHPPGGDGFSIVTKPDDGGKIILSQEPICAERQVVTLNMAEAKSLRGILREAIHGLGKGVA